MTENLIINGVDHAKFDLEWAKRGGVIYHADDGWQILKFVNFENEIKQNLFWSVTHKTLVLLENGLRMATPAECAEAGIEYIEYHGWRPIESAPKNGYFIAKDANGVIFKSRRIRNDFEFFDAISGITMFANPTHWMLLPQPPKDE